MCFDYIYSPAQLNNCCYEQINGMLEGIVDQSNGYVYLDKRKAGEQLRNVL